MKIHQASFNVASLANRVRAGAVRRGAVRNPAVPGASPLIDKGSLDESLTKNPLLTLQPSFIPREDSSYHVNDLLQYHDKSFIQNAYLAILKRGPDATGYTSFIEGLRSGRLNKIDILARLRYSHEGRAKKVIVKGLFVPAAIRQSYRVPIVGYILNLVVAFARMPATIRHQQQFESHVLAQQQLTADHINGTNTQITQDLKSFLNSLQALNQLQHQLAEHLEEVKGQLRSGYDEISRQLESRVQELTTQISFRTEQLTREISFQAEELTNQVQIRTDEVTALLEIYSRNSSLALEERARSLAGEVENLNSEIERAFVEERQIRAEMILQGARVTRLLDRVTSEAPVQTSAKHLDVILDEKKHILDALYLSLENRFRGTREEIIDRCQVYLPKLSLRQVGSADMPILDIACGRGEWLQVLKNQGMLGSGVDLNRVLVEQCVASGLNVVEGEVLEYLKSLPDRSLGAITGFHIVEHLPIESLIQLLDETVRLVKPGGAVIFETPNPENVLVGSCNFYLDPTHRNPLPSQILRFLVESRGFGCIEVLKLNPSDAEHVKGDSDLTHRFNEYFYGPMDYAVLGWKE